MTPGRGFETSVVDRAGPLSGPVSYQVFAVQVFYDDVSTVRYLDSSMTRRTAALAARFVLWRIGNQ